MLKSFFHVDGVCNCTEVNFWLPLTECTRTSTEKHIHRSLSLDGKRSFLINNLSIISCLNYKSTYSEPHWIFYLTGAQRKAEGEETDGLYLEQGCSVKSKRKQWVSESLISTLNLCTSAPSVVAEADQGGGVAFLQVWAWVPWTGLKHCMCHIDPTGCQMSCKLSFHLSHPIPLSSVSPLFFPLFHLFLMSAINTC